MVVRALLPLVKVIDRLPPSFGRAFARALNAGTRPFDVVNYWGSVAASRVYDHRRMLGKLERVTGALAATLAKETDGSLAVGMAFPTRWDPFFAPVMTVADLYAYPTKHFEFHARQLSIPFAAELPG